MSTNQIPAIGVGSLVIFTPNKGQGHHGIVTKLDEAGIKVYGFQLNRTYTVAYDSVLPFRPEDYATMCKQGLWGGVIVRFPNQKTGVVISGQVDAFGQNCKLVIERDEEIYQGVRLSCFETIGHINAT
jgi:hypothetical protein